MSCHDFHNKNQINNIEPSGNSSDLFATLDTAYNQSPYMDNFQSKIINNNSQIIQNQDPNEDILIFPQSEQKINNNVDEMMGLYYNRNLSDQKSNKQYMYPHIPTVQNGVQFPLNRTHRQQSIDSALLEKFNLQQDAHNIWNNTNSTSYSATGMSFFKLILLLILIAALIYAGYFLYKSNSKKSINYNTSYGLLSSPLY